LVTRLVRRAVLCAVCSLTLSCAVWRAEGVGVKTNPAGEPAILNGLRFQAVNHGVNDWGAAVFQVRVTVTNTLPRDTTVSLLNGNCAALMRIYRKPDRSDKPLYDANVGAECYVPVLRDKLEPNASVELASAGDGPAIDLKTGRYYLSVLVTPVAPKGSEDVPPRIELPAGEIDVRRPE
jgi:hypothetical protein